MEGYKPYDKKVGDYVMIANDAYLVNVGNNVLGSAASKNVGKVVAVEEYCVKVQFGGESNIGTYDPLSLAFVYAQLSPTTSFQKGALGKSDDEVIGLIIDWPEYGKGLTVEVQNPQTKTKSHYQVADLVFQVSYVRIISEKTGGQRRTLRNPKRLKSFTARLRK